MAMLRFHKVWNNQQVSINASFVVDVLSEAGGSQCSITYSDGIHSQNIHVQTPYARAVDAINEAQRKTQPNDP